MFYSIKGTLVHMEPGIAVIECGGVGFKCFTSAYTQRAMPQIGEAALLYTTLNVREDALDLFGFATLSEQNCFRLLTNISGVGPKVGLAVLSEMTPEQVALAAASGDSKAFTRASGVGPKLAQRIALELKDKAVKLGAGEMAPQVSAAVLVSASAHAQEAVSALTVLGYSQSEAAAVVGKFDSSLPVEELIRLALRAMASK
jgi:Holliday junction DNA helicase RuvA